MFQRVQSAATSPAPPGKGGIDLLAGCDQTDGSHIVMSPTAKTLSLKNKQKKNRMTVQGRRRRRRRGKRATVSIFIVPTVTVHLA